MAELKTRPTKASVAAFLNAITDEQKRKDSKQLAKLMQEITGHKPVMWGPSLVGYGAYHYKSDRSKQEGDWPLTGFSPRVQNLTVYIMPGFARYDTLMKKLGKYKTGVSCLYFKKLADIDQEVLKELVKESVEYLRKKYS
jgi:hypothetical protein